MTRKRKDHLLASAYAKDPRDEAFLEEMNQALVSQEEASYLELPEEHPILHIVGAPRSGTTLLTQLVTSQFRIGSVTNLAAAFYRAPVSGIRLSRKLLGWGQPSSLNSEYGRTSLLSDPHEFGYFWSDILGYTEMVEPSSPRSDQIDWERFRKVMVNMASAAGGSVVFKSFMLGFYATEVHRVMPLTCFALVHRDPVDNALSILKMRREYSGDENSWTGVKPLQFSEYVDASPVKQAVAQAWLVEMSYRRALERLPDDRTCIISYESLCVDPQTGLERVSSLMSGAGARMVRTDNALPALEISHPQESDERRAVEIALDEIRKQHG